MFNFENTKTSRKWAIILFALFSAFVFGAMFFGLSSQTRTSATDLEKQSSETEQAEQSSQNEWGSSSVEKKWETESGAVLGAALTDDGTFLFSVANCQYNGSAQKPEVTVVDTTTGEVLELGVDFLTQYSNNTNAGRGQVIVTGNGDYTGGSVTLEFDILPVDLSNGSITFTSQSFTYNGQHQAPAINFALDGFTVNESDYTIYYRLGSTTGTESTTAIDAGTYYIEVRGKAQDDPQYTPGSSYTPGGNFYGSVVNTKTSFSIGQMTISSPENTALDGVTLTLDETTFNYDGNAHTPKITAFTVNVGGSTHQVTNYAVTYINSGNQTLDASQVIAPGDYTMRVTVGASGGNFSGTIDRTFRIEQRDLEDSSFTKEYNPSSLSFVYNGSSQVPTVTIRDVLGQVVPSSAYTITYAQGGNGLTAEEIINVGTYTMTVIGNSTQGYTGSFSEDFTITAASITDFTQSFPSSSTTYNGEPQVPTITGVTCAVSGATYETSTSGNTTNAGSYTLTLKGTGNFTGTISKTVTIKKYDISSAKISLSETSFTYDGQVHKPTVTLKVNSNDFVISSDEYDITYSTDCIDAGTVTVYATANSGATNITGTSPSTSFNIARKGLTGNVTFSPIENQTYKGSAISPAFTVTDTARNVQLSLGDDYEIVSYTSTNSADTTGHTDVGTITITIKGLGNYDVNTTATTTFQIVAKTFSNTGGTATVTTTPNSPTYTGKAITLSNHLKVSVSDIALGALTYGQDYTLDTSKGTSGYDNNTNAGTNTAVVYFKGLNNYAGEISVNFTINKKDISGATASVSGTYTYNGSAQSIVTSISLDGFTNDDVTYSRTFYNSGGSEISSEIVNAGSYSVKLTGTGNFTGTTEAAKFSVGQLDISTQTLTVVASGDTTYTGSAITLNVTSVETSGGLSVTFTTSYQNNTEAGTNTAVLLITGKGNFTGTNDDYHFTINPRPLNSFGAITIDSTNSIEGRVEVVYKGSAFTPSNLTIFDDRGVSSVLQGNFYSLKITKTGDSNEYSSLTDEGLDWQNVGTITIVATPTSSNYTGTSTVVVNIANMALTADDVVLTLTTNDIVYNGTPWEPEFTLAPSSVHGGTAIASNEYTHTYNNNVNASTQAEIIITFKNGYTGTITKNFTIAERNISNVTIASISNPTYDGQPHKITPTVTDVITSESIITSADYVVTYEYSQSGSGYTSVTEDNQFINAGYYRITLTGQRNYVDTKQVTYKILPANLNTTTVSAIDSIEFDNQVHNAENIDFTITLGSGGTAVVLDETQYIVAGYQVSSDGTQSGNFSSVTSPQNAGYYRIVLNGQNNFTGTHYAYFEITRKNITDDDNFSLSPALTPQTYTGRQITQTIQYVVWSNYDGSNSLNIPISNFAVNWGANVNAGTNAGSVTITGNTSSNYQGSKTFYFDITAKDISTGLTPSSNTPVYTGSAITLDTGLTFSLSYSGEQLEMGTDWQVDTSKGTNGYSGNINAGEATIYVVGMNNFKGEASFNFNIGQADIDGAVVNGVVNKVYTGSQITQDFTVTFGSAPLTEDVDYTVSYSDNTNVGTATITLKGAGTNFLETSTKTINFEITAKTLTDSMVTVSENVTFNGVERRPKVTVSDSAAAQAMTSSDYQITYTYSQTEGGSYTTATSFVNAGYYRITVTGRGNYTTGSSPVVKTYQILQMNIASVEYDTISNLTYNKQVQQPTPTGLNIDLSANGGSADVVLEEDVDYTVSYNGADYTNAGQKQITITGKGNYKGTATIDYTIDQKALENDWISGASASYVFSNEDNKPEISVIWGGDTVATSNYTVSYLRYTGSEYVTANTGESTNVGQYRISVGANAESQNYTGTATFDYVITPAILEAVNLDKTNSTYNQIAQKPTIVSVTTKNGIGNSSNLDTMFTIKYEYSTTGADESYEDAPDFINAGYYRITVTGKAESDLAVTGDNYFGSVSVVYQIIAKDINTLKEKITFYFGYYKDDGSNDITYTNGENPETIVVDPENRVEMGDAQTYRGQRVIPEILNSENVQDPTVLVRGVDYTFTFPSVDYASAGRITLTIPGIGNYKGTYTVSYNINPATFSPERVGTLDVYETYTGQAITLSEDNLNKLLYDIKNSNVEEGTYAYLKFGTDFQITTFQDLFDNGSVTDDDLKGIEDRNTSYFNNINAGVAVVALEGLGSFKGGMIVEFHISPRSIETYAGEFEFALAKDFKAIYDREQQRPTFAGGTATYTYNSGTPTPLDQGEDYTLDYGANINVADGGTIIIKGTNNFTGTRTVEFDISPYDISGLTPSYTKTAVYDGLPHEPVFTITYVGASLIKGDDFTYTCMFTAEDSGSSVPTTSYIEAGKYVFTIKGQGNFTGQITNVEYTISASALAQILVNNEEGLIQVVYNGEAQTPTIVVKNGKDETLNLTTDYTLSYQVDTGSGYGEASPSEPNWEDVKKVRIKATGAGNYDGSVFAEFEITPKPISDSDITIAINAEKTYNGAPQALMTGEITVQFDGATLAQGSGADYKIQYPEDITNAGEKTITIIGHGNFGEDTQRTYTINRKAFTTDEGSATISIAQGTATYRGTAITLGDGLTLTIRDLALDTVIAPSNYEVNTSEGTNGYNTNINAGTATIYLKGTETGNYVGEVAFNFTIKSKSIADSSINIPEVDAQAFTGEQITPTLAVTDIAVNPDTPLVAGAESNSIGDYYLTYGANTNAGTSAGSIVVHGRGNYTGTRTINFDILAQDLSDSGQIVIGAINPETFTGFAITPTPTVTWTKGDADSENDVTLVVEQDFTYSYDRNTNAGQASLTITFVEGSNYTGSQTTNFTISPASIQNTNIQLSEDSFQFDNTDRMPEVTITLGSGGQTYTLTGSDYEIVEPTDKKNFGQKTITINAQGTNFTGTTSATYNITAKELTADMVSGISNSSEATYTGEQITFDFTITDSAINYTLSSTGNIIDFTFEYDNNTNVTLSPEGDVIAGATLTITPQGNYTGEAIVITFTINQATIDENMVATILDQGYTGNAITLPNLILKFNSLELNVEENFATDYANNKDVSTDDQQASITIKADSKKNANFTGSFTKYFNIVQRTVGNLDDFNVTLATDGTASGTYFYKASAWTPKITLQEKTTGTELQEGTDFDVEYENNINAGEATIRITFTSSYSGTATTTFTISPLDLGEVDIDKISNIPYDGASHQVSPVIRIDGTLVSNEFYSVEYQRESVATEDFASAGTITIVITPREANGITNFTGSTSTEYTIDPQDIDASSVVAEVTGSRVYTGEQLQPTFTLTFGEMTLDTDDYTITEYGANINVADGGTITVEGKGNYFGTKVISFTIEPAILTSSMADYQESVEYTGEYLEPEVTITFNGEALVKDSDYQVKYQDNKDITENALIIITGINNFAGSNFNLTFAIVARNYTDENIRVEWTSSVENLIYTGSEITPTYDVYYTPAGGDEVKLVPNQDFNGVFSDNINAGTATLTISGLNGAGGSATANFTINEAELSTTMFDSLASKEFTGEQITFTGSEISGTYLGRPMVFEQDFIITAHGANINVEDGGTVTVTGQNNFTGEVTLNFTITPKAITNIALSQNNVTFKGSAYDLTVYVYAGGSDAIENTNYAVTYETLEGTPLDDIDLTNAGTTVIVVTASGNYSGTLKTNFTIGKKSIAEQDITVTGIVSKDYNYGQAVTQDSFTVLFGGSIQLIEEEDFTVEYRDNLNAGRATMTLTGTGNYEGVRNVSFDINKIDPTIHPFVENITYYEGDDLPEVLLQEQDTPGTFTPQDTTTLVSGTVSYKFLFVPTDQVNYNSITANVKITAEALIVEVLEITGLEDEYTAYDIFDTTNMQITAIRNNGDRVVVPDGEYTLNLTNGQELTVDDTNLIVTASKYSINGLSYELTINPVQITVEYGDLSNIVEKETEQTIGFTYSGAVEGHDPLISATYYLNGSETGQTAITVDGQYTIRLVAENKNYVITNPETTFNVITGIITSDDGNVTIISDTGFEEGITVTVRQVTDEDEMLALVGELGGLNIERVYLVEMFKNGEAYVPTNDITVRIVADNRFVAIEGLQVYDKDANGTFNSVEFTIDAENATITLNETLPGVFVFGTAQEGNASTWWIYLAAGIAIAIIIILIIISRQISKHNRRRRARANINNDNNSNVQ